MEIMSLNVWLFFSAPLAGVFPSGSSLITTTIVLVAWLKGSQSLFLDSLFFLVFPSHDGR